MNKQLTEYDVERIVQRKCSPGCLPVLSSVFIGASAAIFAIEWLIPCITKEEKRKPLHDRIVELEKQVAELKSHQPTK